MKMNTSRALALVLAGALTALGVTELRATGGGPTAVLRNAAPKTSVGLVNLEKLMTKLDETKSLNDELKATFEKKKKELDEVVTRIKALENERDLLPADSKQRREKSAEVAEQSKLAEARRAIFQTLIDLDNGELVRIMYTKIIASIDSFSQKEGFELVLLDDRGIILPNNATQNQINTAIQAKRILFASDSIDITDRLATLMNAEYNSPARSKK